MGLDTNRIENVKHDGGRIIARCPACAQEGRDRKGNHLFIAKDGRFGCVLYSGEQGIIHRKKIFELVGIKDGADFGKPNIGPIHGKDMNPPEVMEGGILGRLGRLQLGLQRTKKEEDVSSAACRNQTSLKSAVPGVPNVDIESDALGHLGHNQEGQPKLKNEESADLACKTQTSVNKCVQNVPREETPPGQ